MGRPKKIKLYRVTRSLYESVKPRITEFVQKTNLPGITAEGMIIYLAHTAQYGESLVPKGYMPSREFTIACDSGTGDLLGFAHWVVLGLPHLSTALLDQIYIWDSRKGQVSDALINGYIAFAENHKCEIFMGNCIDEKVFRRARIIAGKKGYEVVKSDQIAFRAIKKQEDKKDE